MLILGDAKRQDLATRFKKAADGVYVEAKRSAIGGITQVPLYFYGLLLALGWNELVAGEFMVSLSRSMLIDYSASKSSILHPACSHWCGSICHLDAKPLGTNTEYEQCCQFTRP